MKTTQEQKAWKQTFLIQKRQVESIARDINKLFAFSSTIVPWNDKINKLISEVDQNELKIQKQEKATLTKLRQIDDDVNQLKQTLKYFEHTNEFLVKVQNISQKTLQKLNGFKGRMGKSYQDLADQEQKLNDELELYDKKIEFMISGQGHIYQNEKKVDKQNKKELNLYENKLKKQPKSEKLVEQTSKIQKIEFRMKEKEEECDKIDVQIKSLGKNLGWNEEDHNDFITIWHRGGPKNYFQIQEQLQTYFAFYTGQQIRDHMNKYKKSCELNELKKECIRQYKLLKEEKKSEELRIVQISQKQQSKKFIKEEIKKKQEEEQKLMKQKVDMWKKQKQERKKQEIAIKMREQQQRQMQELIKRKMMEQKNKEILEQWKEQQNQKKQHTKRSSISKRPSTAIDKETEERIRERQEQQILKKLQILQAKKKQEYEMIKKQQQLKQKKLIKYSHVNSKVEEKTTAVKQKQRVKFDGKDKKQANTFGGNILITGTRATPSWMKGL